MNTTMQPPLPANPPPVPPVARPERGPIARFFIGLWDAMNFTRRLILNLLFFFLIFLPPLLFLDGWRIPKEDLRKDAGTVLELALGLVVSVWRFYAEPYKADVTLVVGGWNLLNLIMAGCALGVIAEKGQRRALRQPEHGMRQDRGGRRDDRDWRRRGPRRLAIWEGLLYWRGRFRPGRQQYVKHLWGDVKDVDGDHDSPLTVLSQDIGDTELHRLAGSTWIKRLALITVAASKPRPSAPQ